MSIPFKAFPVLQRWPSNMIRFGILKIGVCCIVLSSFVLALHLLIQSPVHILSQDRRFDPGNWQMNPFHSAFRIIANDKSSSLNFGEKNDITKASTANAESTTAKFCRPRFKFIKEPRAAFNQTCDERRCPNYKKANWTMKNFIKSSAGNFIRRELLRRTWGALSYVEGGRFSTVFLVGRTDGHTATLLEEEHERYGDILQFDGPDDYRSMPLKTLSGMQWAADHLPNDSLYSSGDDDFMLNLGRLQEMVDESRRIVTEKQWPEFPIICTYATLQSAKPVRSKLGPNTKWHITEDEYKWPYYPRCCLGGFYTTSVSVAMLLLNVSRTTHRLHTDDVWITGILREKLGMPNNMVISPKEKIAHHFVGYQNKTDRRQIGFMKNEWERIFEKFRSKKTCFC